MNVRISTGVRYHEAGGWSRPDRVRIPLGVVIVDESCVCAPSRVLHDGRVFVFYLVIERLVESRSGAVALGLVCLLPPLSSGGALVPLC